LSLGEFLLWLRVADLFLLFNKDPLELSVDCVLRDESPLGPEKLFCMGPNP
jgi:hypothetical protein